MIIAFSVSELDNFELFYAIVYLYNYMLYELIVIYNNCKYSSHSGSTT